MGMCCGHSRHVVTIINLHQLQMLQLLLQTCTPVRCISLPYRSQPEKTSVNSSKVLRITCTFSFSLSENTFCPPKSHAHYIQNVLSSAGFIHTIQENYLAIPRHGCLCHIFSYTIKHNCVNHMPCLHDVLAHYSHKHVCTYLATYNFLYNPSCCMKLIY
jgi:hypothetical protein